MKVIKHYLTEYNYATKRHRALEGFTDRLAAQNALLIFAINYLENKDGCEKVKKDISSFLFNHKKFKNALRSSLNPGHYIVRDPNNHVYRLEIWQKNVIAASGWFSSSQDKWTKVMDLDIVEFEFEAPDNNKVYIDKTDLSQAIKCSKNLNNTLENLESFKKLKEGNIAIKSLKDSFPNEFAKYFKKPKAEHLMTESMIIRTEDFAFTPKFEDGLI